FVVRIEKRRHTVTEAGKILDCPDPLIKTQRHLFEKFHQKRLKVRCLEANEARSNKARPLSLVRARKVFGAHSTALQPIQFGSADRYLTVDGDLPGLAVNLDDGLQLAAESPVLMGHDE